MVDKTKTVVTMADLLRLEAQDDSKIYEVEDGEIIEGERSMTWLHMIVIQNLFVILHDWLRVNKLGSVYTDGARYILEGLPEAIQRAYQPDLSFLVKGRMPADFDWNGDFNGTPDLAVEVASPGQGSAELLSKIARYLQAGSQEAWLIYPLSKTLYQFRRDVPEPAVYHEEDTMDTTALFPGLILALSQLFVTE